VVVGRCATQNVTEVVRGHDRLVDARHRLLQTNTFQGLLNVYRHNRLIAMQPGRSLSKCDPRRQGIAAELMASEGRHPAEIRRRIGLGRWGYECQIHSTNLANIFREEKPLRRDSFQPAMPWWNRPGLGNHGVDRTRPRRSRRPKNTAEKAFKTMLRQGKPAQAGKAGLAGIVGRRSQLLRMRSHALDRIWRSVNSWRV